MANEAADRVPVVPRTGRRRPFSEDKHLIVEETCRPGQSLSAVARRYGIDLRPIVPVAASPGNRTSMCAVKAPSVSPSQWAQCRYRGMWP